MGRVAGVLFCQYSGAEYDNPGHAAEEGRRDQPSDSEASECNSQRPAGNVKHLVDKYIKISYNSLVR